ncbi:hypothetical protein HRbin17_01450 [bacterium HR17]|uniref:Glycoside hydrolase n=1 Tax=Candidatus Fervidibacter japonicus TaxID=2035412 RepID=A0A2H5XCM0_9BACT|nr:hypothetical protein HRbin17_01450 [bacterium HR17]
MSATQRPWARWWWLGNAVDELTITQLLQQYRDAGFGGVEICPIYGVKGYEHRFIAFLSPRWLQLLAHTLGTARALGMEVDLTTGTGWPFGGPWVTPASASKGIALKEVQLAAGERMSALPEGNIIAVIAVSPTGERVRLTERVGDGALDWTPPHGVWRLFIAVQTGPVQKVKRAAPGGEGWVVDPYSVTALQRYLDRFDGAFAAYNGPMPRAFFHDSFEYFGATWTDELPRAFLTQHGYDLRDWLPELLGRGDAETVARVRHDYRATVGMLHRAYIRHWAAWCHKHGSQARHQAHGAPANLLDLYADADIPETETFREVDERQVPMFKLAASAAHLKGSPLVSAEAFTWLGEHFQVSLARLKPVADLLFVAGINHLVYHGIAYSPPEAPFPGWLFYASVDFAPQAGLWRDLPAFNAYVTRVQEVLQAGKPDNEVLLYLPWHDFWHDADTAPLRLFTVHDQPRWLWTHPVYPVAMHLWQHGYAFAWVSDEWLTQAQGRDGCIVVGDNAYRALLVPPCRYLPPETLQQFLRLAQAGATVLVVGQLPTDVPGLARLAERRNALTALLTQLRFVSDGAVPVRKAVFGRGVILGCDDLATLLQHAKIPREPMADAGLRFIRRRVVDGWVYFVANFGDRKVDGWVPLSVPAKAVRLIDPMDGRAGLAAIRQQNDRIAIYLQLETGQSLLLHATAGKLDDGQWRYWRLAGDGVPIAGKWQVEFVEGGPVLPRAVEMTQLQSWTELDDPEGKRFHGTARYRTAFEVPALPADDWLLELGEVRESARVWVNGQFVGVLWAPPFRAFVGRFLRTGRNELVVEVTNLPANRIADMDRRGVAWKVFYDINFVNRDYKPFDAAHWTPFPSGLLGPVRLVPVQHCVL